jgi:putative transcriptional regulator
MAIRVQLDRILLERRMSLTELSDRVGVTIANLSILKTGKARAVRFTTPGRPVPRTEAASRGT